MKKLAIVVLIGLASLASACSDDDMDYNHDGSVDASDYAACVADGACAPAAGGCVDCIDHQG